MSPNRNRYQIGVDYDTYTKRHVAYLKSNNAKTKYMNRVYLDVRRNCHYWQQSALIDFISNDSFVTKCLYTQVVIRVVVQPSV